MKKYCIKKDIMGCSFYVYYKGNHHGGGPLFIEHIFGTDNFLEEHKTHRGYAFSLTLN